MPSKRRLSSLKRTGSGHRTIKIKIVHLSAILSRTGLISGTSASARLARAARSVSSVISRLSKVHTCGKIYVVYLLGNLEKDPEMTDKTMKALAAMNYGRPEDLVMIETAINWEKRLIDGLA